MPWTPQDAASHKKGLSATQARKWSAVANSMLASCMEEGGSQSACEAKAIRGANSAVGMPAAHSPQPFQEIVAHISAVPTRREVLDGREYLIARVVPIVESVLNDYLVPAEEIAACVDAWNDLPLPIGHPQNEWGEYVSGKSPKMIEASVGRFFHAEMDGNRLIGEVWLDIEKCQRLGGDAAEVLRRVQANEIVEVSTAFWPQTTMQAGIFNGTAYRGIHRQLRPNHLALLPNGIGACNASMGCGIRAAQAATDCACGTTCTCNEGEALMDFEADIKHPGKLRQALRTLFAFANGPDPDDAPPPGPDSPEEAPADEQDSEKPDNATEEHEETEGAAVQETHVTANATQQPQVRPAALKGAQMLSKNELIAKIVAHEHGWPQEKMPILELMEERMLEHVLEEAHRKAEQAPLTLDSLKTFLSEQFQAQEAKFDKKLATYSQQAEERAEREGLEHMLTVRGWKPEEIQGLTVQQMRRFQQDMEPVSYMAQGMPRFQVQSADDSLPTDEPNWA